MVISTDSFPKHESNAAGPVAGDTDGEINPEELFTEQEDIDFFKAIEKDWNSAV